MVSFAAAIKLILIIFRLSNFLSGNFKVRGKSFLVKSKFSFHRVNFAKISKEVNKKEITDNWEYSQENIRLDADNSNE
jgi:hypothetical protein